VKRTVIAVAVGFAIVWAGVAILIQGDTARIQEAQRRADAIHKKTMAEDEERWKATLERLDMKPAR
jgi:hypothetical protein